MQIRRSACKKPGRKQRFQRILKKYIQKDTGSDGETPTWYHRPSDDGDPKPTSYPLPANRKGDGITLPKHDGMLQAYGPVGLLISSIIWHGFKIVAAGRRACRYPQHALPKLEAATQPSCNQGTNDGRALHWETAAARLKGNRPPSHQNQQGLRVQRNRDHPNVGDGWGDC